jgi:hypothetical protein
MQLQEVSDRLPRSNRNIIKCWFVLYSSHVEVDNDPKEIYRRRHYAEESDQFNVPIALTGTHLTTGWVI